MHYLRGELPRTVTGFVSVCALRNLRHARIIFSPVGSFLSALFITLLLETICIFGSEHADILFL